MSTWNHLIATRLPSNHPGETNFIFYTSTISIDKHFEADHDITNAEILPIANILSIYKLNSLRERHLEVVTR